MRQGRQGQPALDAVLSGMSIHALDTRLTLTDAQEVPSWETPVSGRAVPHGQFPSGLRRRQLEIRLTVHLKAWDAGERGRLYQALCRWAGPGTLSVSWRPGQVLQVDCGYVEGLPSLSACTKTLTVRLCAHLCPFFLDAEGEVHTELTDDAVFTLTPKGTAGARAEVTVVNQETREMTEVYMETLEGDTRQSFLFLTGLHLRSGVQLDAKYDAFGLLTITAGGQSVLAHRSPDSSDELRLESGREQTVHILPERKSRVEVRIFGLYW